MNIESKKMCKELIDSLTNVYERLEKDIQELEREKNDALLTQSMMYVVKLYLNQFKQSDELITKNKELTEE